MQVKFIYIHTIYRMLYSNAIYKTELFLRKSRGNAQGMLLILDRRHPYVCGAGLHPLLGLVFDYREQCA
jgi:hypothetical protein